MYGPTAPTKTNACYIFIRFFEVITGLSLMSPDIRTDRYAAIPIVVDETKRARQSLTNPFKRIIIMKSFKQHFESSSSGSEAASVNTYVSIDSNNHILRKYETIVVRVQSLELSTESCIFVHCKYLANYAWRLYCQDHCEHTARHSVRSVKHSYSLKKKKICFQTDFQRNSSNHLVSPAPRGFSRWRRTEFDVFVNV